MQDIKVWLYKFDPIQFRNNPMITEFDGLDEYITEFSDSQLSTQYRMNANNWGAVPLKMMYKQILCASAEYFQIASSEIKVKYKDEPDLIIVKIAELRAYLDDTIAKDMQLAGEYVLGHALASLNMNIVGGGVSAVRKGTVNASFYQSKDWRAYCESTAFGRALIANIMGDNKSKGYLAPDILAEPPEMNAVYF